MWENITYVRGFSLFSSQMHLTVSLCVLAFGVILIPAPSVKGGSKHGAELMQESPEDPAVPTFHKRNNPIPLAIARLVIKARNGGYCLRRLSSLG